MDARNTLIRCYYLLSIWFLRLQDLRWQIQRRTPSDRAELAWSYRRGARLQARHWMRTEEREAVEKRDLKKYGDRNGPSLEYKVEEYRRLGFDGDELYEQIVKAAFRTNKAFRLGKRPGKHDSGKGEK